MNYVKKFIPFRVSTNQVRIISCYDSRFALTPNLNISDVQVDNLSYTNWKDLSAAIIAATFGQSTPTVTPGETTTTINLISPNNGAAFTEGNTIVLEAVTGNSVKITSPVEGAQFDEGETITIQATAV